MEEHQPITAQQEYRDMNCVKTDLLLYQGPKRVYETVHQKKQVTLRNMIPLEKDFDLSQNAFQLSSDISSLQKDQISSSDIWKVAIRHQLKSILKALFTYLISQTSSIVYALMVLYLLDSLGHLDSSTLFWPYFGICAACIYDAIITGAGYRQLVIASNKIKATIFLALYNRILKISPLTLKTQLEGKVLNSLTEFHSILQNKGHYVLRAVVAPSSIIGISIIMVIRLGPWSLIGIFCLIAFLVLQYIVARCNSTHLEHLNEHKDERMKVLSQILTNFKYIKMQVWQKLFIRKAISVRNRQKYQFIKYGAGLGLMAVGSGGHILSIYATLMLVHNMYHRPLTIELILEVVLLITLLKITLFFVANGINTYFQIDVLFDRVAQVFNANFYQNATVSRNSNDVQKRNLQHKNIILQVKNVSFSFETSTNNKNIFNNVNLKIRSKDFVVIIGDVGSGKTTLLDCIASQLDIDSGQISINGKFSYLEQQLVVFSGTVQQNIILNKKLDSQYYKKVIEWCCLKEDLQSFQNGDMTYIQQKSPNVSGGQKARIALARALYAKNTLILLDDPLSSLDINVAQIVFRNMQKICQEEGFTVIMTIHQTYFINQSNRILHLADGKLRELEGVRQIQKLKEEYSLQGQQQYQESKISEAPMFTPAQTIIKPPASMRMSRINPSEFTHIGQSQIDPEYANISKILQSEEETKVNFMQTFCKFIFQSKANFVLFPLTILCYLISQSLSVMIVYMLTRYNNTSTKIFIQFDRNNFFHILIFLMGVYFVFMWLRVFLLNICIQMSNQNLFKSSLFNLLYSSIKAFKGEGSGQTLDKFSIDLGVLDVDLTNSIDEILLNVFRCVVQFTFITIIFPITIVFALAMIVCAYFLHVVFANVVIPEAKISLALKSAPLLSQFSETMKGIKTIKTYVLQSWMAIKMQKRLRDAIRASISYYKVLNSYVFYSRHVFSILQVILFVILVRQSSSKLASDFLYAIMMLWDLNHTFYWIPGITLMVNSAFTSYNRIKIFINKKKQFLEKFNQQSGEFDQIQLTRVEGGSQFAIQLRNLILKYSQDAAPALKGMNLRVKKGKNIAIVGRTGSGKSSLVQALYRIVEPEKESTYLLNNSNALNLALKKLRKQFCCIPQFPYIFRDTIKKNVDPFDKHEDEDVKRVLKSVGMYKKIEKTQKGILSSVQKKEISLSYGEAQLICLARMLLEKRSIVIMDEANSGIDQKSDEIINEVIRTQCEEQTVITIAHKLLSIIDYDQIIVLRNGEMMEKGTARELFQRKEIFYSMVAENKVVLEKVKEILRL